jgi:hypothetical protein
MNLSLISASNEFISLSFSRVKVISENASIVNLLADGANNAFITDTEHLNYLEKSLNGTKKFTVLKEIVMSDYLGFKYYNNDFMLKPISRIIGQLYESGIAQRIVDNEAALNYEETSTDPVPLSWKHLGIWFYISLGLLIPAVLVFFVEQYVHELKSRELAITPSSQN